MKLDLNSALQNQKLNKDINEIKNADDKKLKEACADFESILMGMMLKTMRSALPGDSIFEKGLADDIYQSMYDQNLTEKIAKGPNNLGLGDQLYRQLSRNKGSINSDIPKDVQGIKIKK